MDLNNISVVARERTPWEALDLGFLMARRWYRPLVLGWMIPCSIIFIVFTMLFQDSLWIGISIAWWLKPVWDRVPLYLGSRALFGEEINVRSGLRALPTLARKDLIAWLTWRRLSLTRSFDMPVTILEGLKGEARQKRLHVLHISSSGAATWLTLICVHIELALVLGGLGLLYLFIPAEVDFNVLGFVESEQQITELIFNVMSFIAMVLVAPFYTMAGFALYISRRISLEGWDIEIRFRHLLERQQGATIKQQNLKQHKTDESPSARIASALVLAVLLPLTVLYSPGGYTTETDTPPENFELSAEGNTAQQDIQAILEGKDFNQQKTVTRWRFKNKEDLEEDEEVPEWLINFIEWLEESFGGETEEKESTTENFILFMAKSLEFILWVIGISLVIFIIYYYRDYLKSFVSDFKAPQKKKKHKPEILFGLDVRKESIPQNVPEEVLTLWRKGKARKALGLLYRATLSRLIHQYELSFNESATEKECAEIVYQSGKNEIYEYIKVLTRVWQRLAYGHRMPSEPQVMELCKSWPEYFVSEN